METRETCIRTRIYDEKPLFSFGKGNRWLTSITGSVSYMFYNGLTEKQIKWLQIRSTRVRQRLTFSCNNQRSENFNLSSVVQFLSWNDMEIGPNPTSFYPFSYTVPSTSDGCLNRKNKQEASSIIELETSNVFRLPVRDMWIKHIDDPEESFMVINVELCFK
ncbi:hypothetical protein PYW08_015808 [Mythimna loreyi]|uniref:Uncharacterized protein n=1 Tax=Mythimna loreyi TaxID=667449 RepID=A0ACC2QTP7_9NEOP|nr:hypothetical protein PYW08_015808 [Mythimna loreyi]